jgi:hypothetical protein
MNLNDLIKSYNWLSIELTLLKLYPDQDKMLDEYRNVYEKLKLTEPADYNELEIILTEYDNDPNFESDKETYVDVSGQKKVPNPNDITNGYAIEFLEWDKWLGMDLAKETIKNFSDLEIIAHCLYEMTFIDYDEEAIQEQFKSLNDNVEEYKKLTEEEKEQKTISLDELKRRLDEKKGSS